ncbi:Hypothetical protein R9X50_00173800 [Acrodontium crateriforme]|uniref:F-box domain-containing protein n=1 Tax=Acrodontium crateriforme TaxID=150365 RepID=A0AAQ3M5P9_9PEZI|nr:Hypothetical protein R9X50_00173800 [Acrodontium crateriforme]
MESDLLQLSNELLHGIFVEIDPVDLAALSQTCRTLRNYISGNTLLHKDLYVSKYDEPHQPPNWEQELHEFEKVGKIMKSKDRGSKPQHLQFIVDKIQTLLNAAHHDINDSRNLQLLLDYFMNPDNIDAFLCASSLFGRAGGDVRRPAPTAELQQASAKLHCLFGVPIESIPNRTAFNIDRPLDLDRTKPPATCTRSHTWSLLTHPYARAKVYDLREYTDGSLWGPFKDDGQQRVDWEKVEAIMIVLGFNLQLVNRRSDGILGNVWDTPFVGAAPNSFVNPPASSDPSQPEEEHDAEFLQIRELAMSLDAQDPFGISGTWMRVVCFLDYNDLYHFNFHTRDEPGEPREPIDTQEAIRLIRVKLQVTRIEQPGAEDRDDQDFAGQEELDWSEFKGERLPVVHFTGTSRSLHASWDPNANSRIRGTVRQTPEGEVRWTTFSIFHGEERWRSEGVQVGGIKSARGVLGNWFDKDFDMHGPAGPTAFWKVSDELTDEKTTSTPLVLF